MYQNMKSVKVAIGVIENEKGQILLTQRFSPESPSVHLKWQLPGGEVEKDEEITEACIREVYEETGYNVEIVSEKPIVIEHPYESKKYILHGFKVKLVSGTINTELDAETADAKWFEKDEWRKMPMLEDTVELIEGCLK